MLAPANKMDITW